MSLEITGKLLAKYDAQQVTDKFKKREFVLELSEEINGNLYTNFAKMQLVQTKCDIIDRYNEGDVVKVSFNIKGTRYEKEGKVSYFSNLDAWRVESASAAPANNNGNQPAPAYNNNNSGNNNGGNNYNQSNNSTNNSPNSYTPANNGNQGTEASDDLPF